MALGHQRPFGFARSLNFGKHGATKYDAAVGGDFGSGLGVLAVAVARGGSGVRLKHDLVALSDQQVHPLGGQRHAVLGPRRFERNPNAQTL